MKSAVLTCVARAGVLWWETLGRDERFCLAAGLGSDGG
jgi:hypothetical protein